MHDCFCEIPQLEPPFSVDELFGDEDYNLFYGDYDPATSKAVIRTNKLTWYDANVNARNAGNIHFTNYYSTFTGMGYITHKPTIKRFQEYVYDTFNKNFIVKMLNPFPGKFVFPSNIIAWTDNSRWHCEGPRDPAHRNSDALAKRFNTVCNFRLMGETSDSKILFGEPSERLTNKVAQLIKEFDASNDKITTELSAGLKQQQYVNNTNIQEGVSVNFESDTIGYQSEKLWEDDIEIKAVKEGFSNPFIMNLSQWHKVCVGESKSPRVTLRLLANKDVPFKDWEKMLDEGTFLK